MTPTKLRMLGLPGLLVLAALLAACNGAQSPLAYPHPDRNPDQVTIDQGLWGDVWFWEGDFMPGTATGTVSAVAREIAVFELTNQADVVYFPDGSRIIHRILTDEVARTASGADGFFQLALPPGEYSVFAVEGEGYYANLFDGQGNILPVTVTEGAVAEVLVNIDYLSTW